MLLARQVAVGGGSPHPLVLPVQAGCNPHISPVNAATTLRGAEGAASNKCMKGFHPESFHLQSLSLIEVTCGISRSSGQKICENH